MNYVLVPIAHGVELKVIEKDYAAPLIQLISQNLTEAERGYFVPLPYNYTESTNARQVEMYNAVEEGLGNHELRRLKHTVGSDVTWSFIRAKDGKGCFSHQFLCDVSDLIDSARTKYPGAKVACIGHSQGTQNFYEFFFNYPKRIDLFISMGSPISMNSGAWEDWGRVPENLVEWINFYHKMDFVSSKLQNCHPSKSIAAFAQDFEVPLGWNPLFYFPTAKFPRTRLVAGLVAHCIYWKNKFVAKTIAGKLKALINS